MGRKQVRTGKYIYLCVAGITLLFLFISGCATFIDNKQLIHSQKLLAKGDYEGAIEENQKILSEYPDRSPGDEALFNMGLIYAHYGNPKKDYKEALSFFWRLIRKFPQSPRFEEAKIWTGVLNLIEGTKMKLEEQESTREYLLTSQKLLAKGDYEGAIEENQKVLSEYPDRSPGDEALFNMGLIYAHLKDYKKSLNSFKRLVRDFPESPRFEEAKIWTDALNTTEETKMRMEGQRSASEYLIRIQKLLAKGDYESAIEENQKILSKYPSRSPGDEALFNMGLIYAHYGNPKKDYQKSILFFNKLIEGYPRSSLVGQAKIWVGVLQVIEKSKQVDIEIEEMKKELSR
jgi:outer membrane protein assembly factor BamD (BamD/ComL family)